MIFFTAWFVSNRGIFLKKIFSLKSLDAILFGAVGFDLVGVMVNGQVTLVGINPYAKISCHG